MKSIIRNFIYVVVLCFISILNAQTNGKQFDVIIQSADKHISAEQLKQSGDIIAQRLKDYGCEGVQYKVLADKSQIGFNIKPKSGVVIPSYLYTHKGEIGFYETYTTAELDDLFKNDKKLLRMLHSMENKDNKTTEIGCVESSFVADINQNLSAYRKNGECKFAWSFMKGEPKDCLYALKLNNSTITSLKGSDIKSINSSIDPATKNTQVELQFKEKAISSWTDITGKNINKPVAVTIDNEVFFTPVIRTKIESGSCMITGDFSNDIVKLFSAIGNSDKLPVEFKVIK